MMEKRQPLQQMLLGKVVIHLQETETRSMSITLYKYQLKIDQGPKYQTSNSEVTTGRSRKHSGTNSYRQGLPQYNPISPATKRKDGQMGLHKIKKLLHNKRKNL
jgi:hypothetical protein